MKILFVSLGCDKNLVDSEEMLGTLRGKGFAFTDDETEADAAIVFMESPLSDPYVFFFVHDMRSLFEEKSVYTVMR